MLHVAFGVPSEDAQLVLGPGLLQILDLERTLAVDQILLDCRLAASGLSHHHVEVADIFPGRHVPRRLPASVVLVAGKYLFAT